MNDARPEWPPAWKASPFPRLPRALGFDVAPLHVGFEFLRVDVNVLLTESIEQPVVAESRVVLVQTLDLSSDALVDGVVLAGGHRTTSALPRLVPRPPAEMLREALRAAAGAQP